MSCVFACVLDWSSNGSSHARCRKSMFKNPAFTLQKGGQGGSFLLHKERVLKCCVFLPDCVYTWNSDGGGDGGPQRGPPVWTWVRNTVCNGHVTVSVCLNYLAQRPDRGVNQVRSSLLQCFSFSPSTHLYIHPSCSDVAEFLRYSVSLNKQELSNKRLPTCYGCPLNYGRLRKEKHQSN